MKNRILFILVFLIHLTFVSVSFSKQVEFKAKNIEIIQDQDLTIANDALAIIDEDDVSIKGKKIQYFKKNFCY